MEQQEASESSPSPEVTDGLIYSTQGLKNGAFPPKITLVYGGDLVAVSENSQALLVGINLGAKPCALVEIGGRGRVVQTGDLLGKYRVLRIKENEMELERD
ncbi:MAG: hypothetical protein NT099_02610 [Candidatus Saganbacteria bacterium]|nr:hypothetical protein [Candidatus Saganbacteria bacterium]